MLAPDSLLWTLVLGLVVAFLVTQLANFVTTVHLHRALSHRALEESPGFAGVMKVLLWLTTGIRTRQWVAVHRKHHAFTDEPQDPHSPARLGWVRVQLTNVALYRRVARDEAEVRRYAKDLPRTRWDALLFDHAFLGLGIGVALLVVVFGWRVAVVAGVVHMAGYLMLSGAVNAVAHTFGRRTYDNSATNVQWLALLTGGEGLHNNHHAAPTSARFSLDGGWDPSWGPIRLFERLGWVRIRHREPRFVVPRRTGGGRTGRALSTHG